MSKSSALIQSAKDSLPPALAGIIMPIITSNPVLAAPMLAVVGLYGWSVVYRQERFNGLMQSIVDNPSLFTEELMTSVDFQDGLVTFVDDYFKLRDDDKLIHARNIFHDFASSSNKPLYPLERYNDTLLKISDASIKFLGFVESEIPDIKEKHLADSIRQNNNDKSNIPKENFRKIYVDSKPLSTFVDLWIETKVKKSAKDLSNYHTAPLDAEGAARDKINTDIGLTLGELEQLGLLKHFSYSTGSWEHSSVSGYNLTHYGRMFTSVIKPESAGFMV